MTGSFPTKRSHNKIWNISNIYDGTFLFNYFPETLHTDVWQGPTNTTCSPALCSFFQNYLRDSELVYPVYFRCSLLHGKRVSAPYFYTRKSVYIFKHSSAFFTIHKLKQVRQTRNLHFTHLYLSRNLRQCFFNWNYRHKAKQPLQDMGLQEIEDKNKNHIGRDWWEWTKRIKVPVNFRLETIWTIAQTISLYFSHLAIKICKQNFCGPIVRLLVFSWKWISQYVGRTLKSVGYIYRI